MNSGRAPGDMLTKESSQPFGVVPERYGRAFGGIWKQAYGGPRLFIEGALSHGETQDRLRAGWDRAWLRGALPTPLLLDAHSGSKRTRAIRTADLFSGCGAMSLGLKGACEALGWQFSSVLAADCDTRAIGVYERNFNPALALEGNLAAIVEWSPPPDGPKREGAVVTRDPRIHDLAGGVDVLIAGPPCQGHSNLNNHSRRNDPKNSLYALVPAVAQLLRPEIVIVENVPSVVHDKRGVVEIAVRWLRTLGYQVETFVVALDSLGVAQQRKRHVLVASRRGPLGIAGGLPAFETARRPVSWAITDLSAHGQKPLDKASDLSPQNRKRVDWLFDNGAHDLPNSHRPRCHRNAEHTYLSMYGRMRWHQPAQTITTGFLSPGQGRFIHPRERRTITIHEAARLQFFPDSFVFESARGDLARSHLATMVGNAVPPKLSYVVGLLALGQLMPREPDGLRSS